MRRCAGWSRRKPNWISCDQGTTRRGKRPPMPCARKSPGPRPRNGPAREYAGFGDVLNQPAANAQAAAAAVDGKKAADDKKVPTGRKGDELDKTIDNLIAGQKDLQEKQAAVSRRPVARAQAVMNQIKTPGTPEAKRFEEKLATMHGSEGVRPAAQKRVERAQKEVDEAKAALGK